MALTESVCKSNIIRYFKLFFKLSLLFTLLHSPAFSQIRFGPKVAIYAYAPIYSDAILSDSITVVPQIGFNAGIAMDYRINDRFSFYTELVYSRKGKKLKGGVANQFSHIAKYHYLEVPMMLRLNFTGSTKRGGNYDWYISGGGFLSYWLSGKGVVESIELIEINIPDIAYKISFEPADPSVIELEYVINLEEPNRIQAGLVIETGIGLNFRRKQHLLIGLRYNFRQSWLGRDYNIDISLDEYKEDFRTLEHTVSITTSWVFEWNIGDGKKGKSTDKKRKKS